MPKFQPLTIAELSGTVLVYFVQFQASRPKMSCPDTDELVVNVAAVNFSGRFKGQEVKDLGHAFLNHVVAAKHVGLVLGQQVGDLERDGLGSHESFNLPLV